MYDHFIHGSVPVYLQPSAEETGNAPDTGVQGCADRDRDFLSEQSTSRRGRIVIESVIHLARALSITTVAEGIENLAQLEFMKSIHCDIGQGYYFAKPMPVEEFERTVLHMREG